MKALLGMTAIDLIDNSESDIIDATNNSIRLLIKDKKTQFDPDTGKSMGIDAYQWFIESEFNKKFKIKDENII